MMDNFFKQPVLDAVKAAEPIATEAGVTLAQLSLAWCLRNPAISSVIVGATKAEHLDDSVAAADLDLDADVLRRFEEALAAVVQRPTFE